MTIRDIIHKISLRLRRAKEIQFLKVQKYLAQFDRLGVVVLFRNTILHFHYILQPFTAYVTGVIYLVACIFDFNYNINGMLTTFTVFYYLSIKKFKLQKVFWALLFIVAVVQFFVHSFQPFFKVINIMVLFAIVISILFLQKTVIFRSSRYDYWAVTYLLNIKYFFLPNKELDRVISGVKDISKIKKFKYNVHHQLNAHLARFQGLSNLLDLYMHDSDIPKVLQTAVMMQQVSVEIRKEILQIADEFHSELEKDMTND